jgi:hypothetical protein
MGNRLCRSLVLLTLLTACKPDLRREVRLDGEWIVDLTPVSPTVHSGREIPTRGVIVISQDLPDFPDWAVEIDRSRPYAVGRFRSLDQADRVRETRDVWQEAEVRVRGDTVVVQLSPRVADGGFILLGRREGQMIRGRWQTQSYCCVQKGLFEMQRQPATALSTAALRAAREKPES